MGRRRVIGHYLMRLNPCQRLITTIAILFTHCSSILFSLNQFCQVPGVGIDNSLQITLNSTTTGKKVRYRIFISEVGTTVSKVFFDIDPLYRGHQTFHIHGIHYVQV